MAIEIKVPVLPESVADATIATWHKQPGDPIERDEILVDIETDKVVLEVVAPDDGTLESVIKDAGATVLGQEVQQARCRLPHERLPPTFKLPPMR